jgi:sugar porter (SP) family MFS transporter
MAGQGPPVADGPSAITDEDFSSGGTAVRIASVAALGGLLFGYDSAVINGANDAIQKLFGIGDLELGFAVASALLGAAVGAMTAGRIADKIGRISVMKIAALFFLISAIGTAFAPEVWVIVVFRILGGVGVGIASVIAPAYIAETSPPRIRGRLGSLQQLAIVSGIFLSFAVNWLLQHVAGGDAKNDLWLGMEAWRWMFMVMAIPAIVYGALAFTIPESPRYLVASHKIPEARKVLTMLLGEKNLEITIDRIKETLEREDKPSWRDLRKPGAGFFGLYGIVWVGLGLSVFQQFVGINVIFYYSNVLWQAVGFSADESAIYTVITSVINVATTLIAIALIDKIGRKPLLLIGSSGMAITLITMAVIFANATLGADGKPSLPGASGVIALIAANLFVVSFGMSWGPVVWVLLGEMFPNRIRAAALGLAAAGQWAANWAITVSFPQMRAHLGLAYGFYGLCAVLSFVFVWRWVQETKGVSLEDMRGDVLASSKPVPTA